jgi:hypothetical protein
VKENRKALIPGDSNWDRIRGELGIGEEEEEGKSETQDMG